MAQSATVAKSGLSVMLALLLLSACGGGGVSTPSVQSPASIAGRLVLTIGTTAPASIARTPKFISPSALSVAISANGATPTIADISSTSPQCVQGQGSRVCTIALVAPAGNDVFTITQYDGPNATGKVLGSGSATVVVSVGVPFVVQAVLNGVVGTIQLVLGTIPPRRCSRNHHTHGDGARPRRQRHRRSRKLRRADHPDRDRRDPPNDIVANVDPRAADRADHGDLRRRLRRCRDH